MTLLSSADSFRLPLSIFSQFVLSSKGAHSFLQSLTWQHYVEICSNVFRAGGLTCTGGLRKDLHSHLLFL